MASIWRFTGIILFFFTLCVFPAVAGSNYLNGEPLLSANISGINEFSPGNDADISVIIENTGISQSRLVQSGITDRDDLPTTAKFLTATLMSGDAPVTIKSDPQMLGDLKGSSSVKVIFNSKIQSDAPAGNYVLPLYLNYTYLDTAEQFSVDSMKYYYKVANLSLKIPIHIKPDVSVAVVSAVPDQLNAGTEGYINMTLKNIGSDNGTRSVVKITRNGMSPIIPVDNSVYIGDFSSGATVQCRYKVSVSEDAENQQYPVDVVVVYVDENGDTITSRSETVGISVGSKTTFSIISGPAEMNPGNKKSIHIEYKNTGQSPVYSAKVRISAVDPFTISEDIAYIGDMQPNESKVVVFPVSVDRSATAKQYGLDSEIRYRDALDNTYISDIMKVTIDVKKPEGITIILSNPIYLSVIAAIIIGILYMLYHYRKKQ